MVTKDIDLARCLGHFYNIDNEEVCLVPKREYRIEEIISRTNTIHNMNISIKQVRPTAPNIRAYFKDSMILFQLKHAWTLGLGLSEDDMSVVTYIPGYTHSIDIVIGSLLGVIESMYVLKEEKV
jgi:hypothetical protein